MVIRRKWRKPLWMIIISHSHSFFRLCAQRAFLLQRFNQYYFRSFRIKLFHFALTKKNNHNRLSTLFRPYRNHHRSRNWKKEAIKIYNEAQFSMQSFFLSFQFTSSCCALKFSVRSILFTLFHLKYSLFYSNWLQHKFHKYLIHHFTEDRQNWNFLDFKKMIARNDKFVINYDPFMIRSSSEEGRQSCYINDKLTAFI